MNNRIINLSTKDLSTYSYPEEILLPNFIHINVCRLLTEFDHLQSLMLLRNIIQNTIISENIYLEFASERDIDNKDVFLIVDLNNCDLRTIKELNCYYHIFDVNNLKPLSFISEIQKYGATLSSPFYEFYLLILKCMCTVNTRIHSLNCCPTLMNITNYNKQDFLKLIELITTEKTFILIIEEIHHKIICPQGGWITVDWEPITLLSDLSENINKVIISIYKNLTLKHH